MAKKKINLKSIFKAKLTKIQIITSLFFILVLFSSLVYLFFSSKTILQYRMIVYSGLLQEKNNYYDYLQTLTPTPTPIPKIVVRSYIPPTPIPTIKISNPHKVDELQVSHSIALMGSPVQLTPFKTITNAVSVQNLYDAILALPPIPTGIRRWGGVAHPSVARYDLNFMYKGNLVHHGVIIIESYGIPTSVSLDGSYTREFYDQKSFTTLVEKTFGLTSIYPPQ